MPRHVPPLFLTTYEATQIVALRASLLSDGALPQVDPGPRFDAVLIASRELLAGKIDCVVRRGEEDVHVTRFRAPQTLRTYVRLRVRDDSEKEETWVAKG